MTRGLPNSSDADRTARIDAGLLLACDDNQPAFVKPSIETFFHALLDTCVIHLHPEAVLAAACAKNGQKVVEKLFAKEKYPPLWIPYVGLGYVSARKIQTLMAQYKQIYGRTPQVMVMQNHGLLVSAGSSAAAMRLVKKTVAIFTAKHTAPKIVKVKTGDFATLKNAQLAIRQAVFKTGGGYTTVRCCADASVLSFMARPNAKALCGGGALTPDEAVVAHGGPLWVEHLDGAKLTGQLEKIKQAKKLLPIGFAVKGLGLLTAAPAKEAAFVEEFLRSYLQVRQDAARSGGVRFIPATMAAHYAESKKQASYRPVCWAVDWRLLPEPAADWAAALPSDWRGLEQTLHLPTLMRQAQQKRRS